MLIRGPFWTSALQTAIHYSAIHLLTQLARTGSACLPVLAVSNCSPSTVLAINRFSRIEEYILDPEELSMVQTIAIPTQLLAAALRSAEFPVSLQTKIPPSTLLDTVAEGFPELWALRVTDPLAKWPAIRTTNFAK